MLLESPDSPDGELTSDLAATFSGFEELGTPIQDDIERLIAIAAQLFSAIERQIHHIEQDLNYSQSGGVASAGATVFKEQLIRTAASLHDSLNEIAIHLDDRAQRARSSFSPLELLSFE
jgi:hypothetical protein